MIIYHVVTQSKNAFSMKIELEEEARTCLGGYPRFIQRDEPPSSKHKLLLKMSKSEASTNNWDDDGVGQVWMTTGDDFGDFIFTVDCY